MDLDPAGDLVVSLIQDVPDQVFTVTGGGTGADNYHTYEISYDPSTGKAAFLFDGTQIDNGSWLGHTNPTPGVYWGSGSSGGQGSAHYHLVQMDLLTNKISGHVFEDVNYGGGAGRDMATAAADAPSFNVGRPSVTVELYDVGGALRGSTVTGAGGAYSFSGLPAASYTVRVVNATVTSSRPGSDGTELAVQTFRADGTAETLGEGTRKVGGEFPAHEDAAANGGAQTLAALQGTDTDTDGVTEWTQSIVTVTVVSTDVSGIDFGFNCDTVVTTNDAGQGSLRQFILNSNLLN